MANNTESNNEEIPEHTSKDGSMFIGLGLLFLLITVNVAFEFVMFMMKGAFFVMGIGFLILGVVTIIKYYKKKRNIQK